MRPDRDHEGRAAAIFARIDDSEMDRLVDALARVLLKAAEARAAAEESERSVPRTLAEVACHAPSRTVG
ncbi:MAG TPA: hypothetical protein VN903_00875 [Polyangia bacterium]|nr:hypothetical protein [Gemmatimonadales bacterium]HXT99511.1 hypothetical protein [Polyangia bacterium]